MTDLQRRRVHLLVPDGIATCVLVADGDALPVLDLAFPGGTTGTEVVRVLRNMGIDRPLVDCCIDVTEVPDDIPNPVVVQIAAPDAVPEGWRWAALADVRPPDGVVGDYVRARLAEWRGDRAVPATRSPWVRPGWYERARAWVDGVLTVAVGVPSTDMVPYRMWGISAVFRVTSSRGDFWFKAVHPHFHAEPPITARLSRLRPGSVPAVVAIDADDGWLLVEHLEGTGTNVAVHPGKAVAALVDLQRTFVDDVPGLLAMGLPDRRLVGLVGDLRHALALPVVGDAVALTDARAAAVVDGVAAALPAVLALGVPDTLVHGDFHPNNVTIHADAAVVFDWSDAAVGCPLVDVGAWGAWLRDDPAGMDELWRCVAEAWAPTVDPARVLAARPAADAVVAAYHVVSYAHIVHALEPLRRDEVLSGVTDFFADLTVALAAAGLV